MLHKQVAGIDMTHTIGLVHTTKAGLAGQSDLLAKQEDMRSSCRAHGFELDGMYHQGPFDAAVWPFLRLSQAFEEKMEIIVVHDLSVVATHPSAPLCLPIELAKHKKSLYSINDRRLFLPDDDDFESLLRKAFDRYSDN
jgi:hypothetical protein